MRRQGENLRKLVAILALALGAQGCVTAVKEREVDSALRGVGFTAADAQCLAARAGRQLSIRQLRALERAANELEQPVREMPVGDVIEAIRTHVDSDTLAVVVRLSADCARARLEAKGG
jgi:hypothetical protein